MTIKQDLEATWTIEAIDRLRELAVEHVPAELIATAMHRPEEQIRQKAAELGLSLEIGSTTH
ncbi:hypothetical protein [Kaistia sp. MMO-174]|uniref:hypothetical protein n=1 Tax=Kaistia sp. MMO-174 TaxID=3081256 RepID=UPI001AC152B2|nr:hypothetical protein [Hyphomicrobiales bacterium]MBN9058348.1 hypothetical protein [Hyphomicrobiales bacterium]